MAKKDQFSLEDLKKFGESFVTNYCDHFESLEEPFGQRVKYLNQIKDHLEAKAN